MSPSPDYWAGGSPECAKDPGTVLTLCLHPGEDKSEQRRGRAPVPHRGDTHRAGTDTRGWRSEDPRGHVAGSCVPQDEYYLPGARRGGKGETPGRTKFKMGWTERTGRSQPEWPRAPPCPPRPPCPGFPPYPNSPALARPLVASARPSLHPTQNHSSP